MNLYELAVRKPVLIVIGLVTLFVMGGVSAYKLPIEFLPRVEFPFIGVFVPYPNSHPDYIERQIVKPIENVMATLGDVRRIRAQAEQDMAFVGVEFAWGRDVGVLRMEVKEKIDQIRDQLPADVENVNIFTFDSNDIPILEGRISAEGKDLSGNYDLIERAIINPLKRIEGVGTVNIDGVQPREIAIYLKISRLRAHRVDVNRLFQTLQGASVNASAGEITADGLRYAVRSVGAFRSREELENLVVNEEGLKLSDIADIHYGEPAVSYGRYLDGKRAVAFWIQKASNANTVEVARRVHAAMDRMNSDPALEGLNVLLFFDQSKEILHGVRGLRQAGLIGGFFAVFILYFFLRRLTTTLIVAVAIPFSIICTLAFLYFSGRTLNMLTMMGLMLGVGMLVDNAIVVLESIFRHQVAGVESRRASIEGTREVATAVVAATMTSVIVFAPIVFGSGDDELVVWLSSVGITISVAILFSLLISLTLIPFLTSRLLKPRRERTSKFLVRVQKRYVTVLRWTTLRHPGWTVAIVLGMLALTGAGVAVLGLKGPGDDDALLIDRVYMEYKFVDNTGYKASRETVERVEKELSARTDSLDIRTVYSFFRDNFAATTVYFNDRYLSKEDLKEKRKALRRILPDMAGVTIRMGEKDGTGGAGATQLQVNLFGEDKQVLDELAAEARRRLAYLGELNDLESSVDKGRKQIQIDLDRELTSRYALTSADVTGIMNLTFRGMQLARFQGRDREIPVSISLDPDDRVGLYNLKNLLVGVHGDREVSLGSVARLLETRGPARVTRDNQRTMVSVSGSYEGDDFDALRGRVTRVMNSMSMPMGYSWSYSERIQSRDRQRSQMGINALLAVICVYMLMAALFESFLHPLIIMVCLPLAAVGVVWTLLLTGTAFGLMAMIGTVILVGVVVNNGIVLIDHINDYRDRGYPIADAVIEGGRARFRPIVMTAATTVLGLLPMALGNAHVGDAQYYPLARAVMGGLISSTFLTLLVLPSWYVLGERLRASSMRIWVRARDGAAGGSGV